MPNLRYPERLGRRGLPAGLLPLTTARLHSPMSWIYLIIAGVFEWGWPVGLKLGMAETGLRWNWILFAMVCMALSGVLLMMAQKTIPIGTAYAVWTGIGAVGTFFLGIFIFSEPTNLARFFFVGLIIVGILGLKMASAT